MPPLNESTVEAAALDWFSSLEAENRLNN